MEARQTLTKIHSKGEYGAMQMKLYFTRVFCLFIVKSDL